MKRVTMMLAALVLILGEASQVKAQTLGVDFAAYPGDSGGSIWNLGWGFTANSTVNVVGLLNVDLPQTGYAQSQQVGLWDASGNLLASAYVTSSDPLVGALSNWRLASITPVTLTAGQYYVVGAQGGADYTGGSSLSVNPAITYVQDLYTYNGGANSPLVEPLYSEGLTSPSFAGWFGANIELASVPEPSGFALFGLSIVCLAVGYVVRKRTLAPTAA